MAAETLLKIRVRALAYQTQTVARHTLGGVPVGFRFRWLAEPDRWVAWLLDAADDPIFGPTHLVPGLDLFAGRQHDPRVPPGELFVHSVPFTREDADEAASLLYREP